MTNEQPFVIEKVYNASPERVWKAITDRNEMKKWYFDLAAFEPKVGFEFRFDGGSDCVTYRHICIVTEVEENKRLAYSWQYEGLEGRSVVTFELFPEGNKTLLRVTHTGLETLAHNGPDFSKESFSAGWNAIIGANLKEFVEN